MYEFFPACIHLCHVHAVPAEARRGVRSTRLDINRELRATMQVLRTKLGSSAEATSALNCSGISPAPRGIWKRHCCYFPLGEHPAARSHSTQEASELLTTEWLGSSSPEPETNMSVWSRGSTSAVLLAT